MLLLAASAWMLIFPNLAKADGTAQGTREIIIHYSLGGVFILLAVAILASSSGSLAKERAAKRLQLTMVRPARYALIALGSILAHTVAAAFVMLVAFLLIAPRVDLSTPCSHVTKPIMPSTQEEAKAMYDIYMADTNTPVAVREAKKSVVLRLLANRAVDRYETIGTNEVGRWRFRVPDDTEGLAVRMRFTNQLDMRQDLLGEFRLGTLGASISNITQAVLTIPLKNRVQASTNEVGTLEFFNKGVSAVMLRPRKDIELLHPADEFWKNMFRAYLECIAIFALLAAFGTVLSASLGRSVAIFVAFVALAVSEMSPSVVKQYPDELEKNALDRAGLYIARFTADFTRPISSLSPIGKLAKDECVEYSEVGNILLADLIILPTVLSLLAALGIARKEEDI
jgi:hypothetical protein